MPRAMSDFSKSPVSASAPIVRPWNPLSAAIILVRPVSRANLNAASLASAPELHRNTRSAKREAVTSSSANRSGGSL